MDESTQVEEIQKHVRTYVLVFASLAVLTVVTVAVAYLHLSIVPALIVALFIATVKGSLVAAYFMHLISERKVIYSLVILTVGLLITMFVLFTSAHIDQDGGIIVP
jgi:cytochrome c oxidase subunit IV